MRVEWRVAYRRYVNDRHRISCDVVASLRGDGIPEVTANYREPWRSVDDRPRRLAVLASPSEIRAEYEWRQTNASWAPLGVYLSGRDALRPLLGDARLTIRVDQTSLATPDFVREFVAWATPDERPSVWVGCSPDHGFYSSH